MDLDGDGIGSAESTKFTLDGWNPAKSAGIGQENFDVYSDHAGGGSLTTRYLRGDHVDELLGRHDVSGANAGRYWYLTDNQGSIRAVVDNDGIVRDSIEYDAYGNITQETDPSYRGRYAWTAREIEVETGLQYNRARYYDPQMGRWISKDPMGFDAGDSNLYRYVRNSPTNHTDPSGYFGGWGGAGTVVVDPKTGIKHQLNPISGTVTGQYVPGTANGGGLPGAAKGAAWRVTWVLEQSGSYREMYSMEAAELRGRTDAEAGVLSSSFADFGAGGIRGLT